VARYFLLHHRLSLSAGGDRSVFGRLIAPRRTSSVAIIALIEILEPYQPREIDRGYAGIARQIIIGRDFHASLMPNLPTAILFDLDDTILAAFGQAADQWQRVVAEFADRLEPHPPADIVTAVQDYSRYLWADQARHKHWRHRIGEARRHIVENALCGLATSAGRVAPPLELCHAVADRFQQIHEAELRIFPGAHETLDRLKELGVKLALVTNGGAEAQRAKVVRFALEHRFDHIQIEGEHGFGKPEEQAYSHALASLGVEARETWMVGDNLEWEVVAPQRLGIFAIWYDGNSVGLPADSAIRPDRIIRTLPELLE
jgi:putative hydrolase of the HAD superfamily